MIEKLKEMGFNEETIQKIMDSVNAIVAQKDKEMENLKLNTAIDIALNQSHAKTGKAVRALLDMEAITLNENGEAVGLKEQLEALKSNESTGYLFDKSEFKGVAPAQSQEDIPNVDNMNYTELCAYFDKNNM